MSKKSKKLRKWTQVYPQGTKAGDEEQKFFIALARHPKFEWRTVAALSKETGLTKERVEEIVAKYEKAGMVFNNPKNEEQWAYWERVPEMVADAPPSLTKADQNDRIDKVLNCKTDPFLAPRKNKKKAGKLAKASLTV